MADHQGLAHDALYGDDDQHSDVERQLGWPVATTRMAGWPSRPKHIEGAGSWGPRQAIVVVASTRPGGDRVGEWEGPARASGPVLTDREGRGSWWAGLKGALLLPGRISASALLERDPPVGCPKDVHRKRVTGGSPNSGGALGPPPSRALPASTGQANCRSTGTRG